jgi:hypothetical protein
MEYPDTLTEVINTLRREGYTEDFNLRQNWLECREGSCRVMADEFKIDQVFRFDDNTDPDDESVLYAISSEPHGLKGILVNSYSIYSEPLANELAAALRFHQ